MQSVCRSMCMAISASMHEASSGPKLCSGTCNACVTQPLHVPEHSFGPELATCIDALIAIHIERHTDCMIEEFLALQELNVSIRQNSEIGLQQICISDRIS